MILCSLASLDYPILLSFVNMIKTCHLKFQGLMFSELVGRVYVSKLLHE